MGYINNSRKWDKCAVLLNTAHVLKSSVVEAPPSSYRPCLRVVMLSCLYVVGRHSLVLTDLRRKGACNQGKGSLRVVKYQFTRRHSFCNFYQECTLPRFSRNRQKKTSSSDKVSFISPIRYSDWLGFQYSN